MARRLDWEKARSQQKSRRRPKGKRKFDPQPHYAAFVKTHNIACFKCGATEAQWAKTGISKRGAWCICLPCVQAAK